MLHVPMHVALITEKLRGQTLDDDHLKVPREGALQIEGKNVWLACDGGDTRDQEGNTTSREGRGMTSAGGGPSTFTSFLPPLNDNERLVLGAAAGTSTLTNTNLAAAVRSRGSPTGCFPLQQAVPHGRFPIKPVARVKSNLTCTTDYMRAFDTPPKKKHCRSLSVPADSPPQPGSGGAVLVSTSPQVEGAKVWRPIPTTAMNHVSSFCQGDAGGRTLPSPFSQASSHHSFSTVSSCSSSGSASARFSRDYRVMGVFDPCGGSRTSSAAMTTTTFLPMAPPSPSSVDSGRDTTSDLHTTPPQSPVPRPSSATSLRSAHTAFSASSFWSGLGYHRSLHRSEVLQSRSLSYEEQMSPGLQPSASGSSPCVASGSGVGLGYPGGFGGSAYSLPLSPCRNKIPRCHSQPCVLHDRRCGKKRRRDDRPTLDFHKMTETAYKSQSAQSVTPAQDIQRVRWRGDLDSICVGGLMPIASSPRDTELPATPRATDHAALSSITDLDLPTTPPASDISSGIDIYEPVKLIGEEEEEEELEDQEGDVDGGSNCGCHRDSGSVREGDSHGMFPLTDLDLAAIENS